MYATFGICDTIYQPQLTVNDLNISYRTVNYWDKSQLLLSQRKTEKSWRKFSFIDYLWINIVQNLREFGFATETIQKIKDLLTSPVPNDVLKTITRKEHLVQPKDRNPSFLTNIAAELVSARDHISILYKTDGTLYVLYLNTPINGSTGMHITPYINYVCLSLSEIYLKFLQSINIRIIEKLKIIPEPLVKTAEALRSNALRSITFHYNEQQVTLSQEDYFEEEDFVRDCLRLLTTTAYSSYETNYNDGPCNTVHSTLSQKLATV